jgi:hypothetical protein
MPKYEDENTRKLALKRALKIQKLFDKGKFAPIMNAVDPLPSPGTFRDACRAAGLNDDEIIWLWTYLKECTHAIYDPIPEAAGSGW